MKQDQKSDMERFEDSRWPKAVRVHETKEDLVTVSCVEAWVFTAGEEDAVRRIFTARPAKGDYFMKGDSPCVVESVVWEMDEGIYELFVGVRAR